MPRGRKKGYLEKESLHHRMLRLEPGDFLVTMQKDTSVQVVITKMKKDNAEGCDRVFSTKRGRFLANSQPFIINCTLVQRVF